MVTCPGGAPVAIDYEAAWGMLKRGDRTPERARWIVNAALGIVEEPSGITKYAEAGMIVEVDVSGSWRPEDE